MSGQAQQPKMNDEAARPSVMHKLLWPAQTEQIFLHGRSHIGGPVVRAADVSEITDPAELIAAYGLTDLKPYGTDPEYVDVLRFPATPLMRFSTPGPGPERPWPTYERGFLPASGIVPVWQLDTTRVPAGTELWRIRGDGQHSPLSYAGPAVGWRNGRAWRPALGFVGPHVEWRGQELLAAFGADDPSWMELISYGEAPPGFKQARLGAAHAMVPRADCTRVFDIVLSAVWRGVPCRILDRAGDHALLQVLGNDPEHAALVGATAAEPGVFEVVAPSHELQAGSGSTFELDGGPSGAGQ